MTIPLIVLIGTAIAGFKAKNFLTFLEPMAGRFYESAFAAKVFGANLKVSTGAMVAFKTAASMGVTLALMALIYIFDQVINRSAKLQESIDSLGTEIENTENEIKTLNDELATTNQRMVELLKKPSLTIIEESELTNLKNSNRELEISVGLLEKEAVLLAKKKNAKIIDKYTWEQGSFGATYWDELFNPVGGVDGSITMASSGKDFYLKRIETFNDLIKERKTDTDLFKNLREEILETALAFNEYAEGYIAYDKTTQSHKNFFINMAKKGNEALNNEAKAFSENLDKILNSPHYKKTIDEFKKLARSGELTKNHVASNVIVGYVEELGLTTDEVVNGIYALAEAEEDLEEETFRLSLGITKTSEELKTEAESLSETYKNLKGQIESLISTQKSQAEGTVLSTLQMISLIEEYPELAGSIKEVENGYILEENAIEKLVKAKLKLIGITKKEEVENARQKALLAGSGEYGLNFWASQIDAGTFDTSRYNALKPETTEYLKKYYEKYDWDKIIESDGVPFKEGESSSKKTENKKIKAFDDLKLLYQREIITAQDYYNKLNALDKKYYANNADYQDEHEQVLQEMYDLQSTISQDRINDMEHEIYMLQRKAGTEEQQIEIYKNVQEEIISELKRYQELGLDENSDTIQELRKQWEQYGDNIVDIISNSYEKIRAEIDHEANILSRADGNEQELVDLYRKAQDSIVEQYRKSKDDQSEANQSMLRDLESQWYSYADKITDINSAALDKVESMFSGFQAAVVKQLDKELESLNEMLERSNENFDSQIDALNEQKNAMDKQVDAQKELLDIEEKRKALEDAKKQKTALIYREGRGFDYEVDADTVEQAQKNYDSAVESRNKRLRDEQYDNQIKALEDAKKASADSINAQVKNLETLKKGWGDALNIQSEMDMYSAMLFSLSGFENMNYMQRSEMLHNFSNTFNDLGVVKTQIDLDKQTKNFADAADEQAIVGNTQQQNLMNLHETFGNALDISGELKSYSNMIGSLEKGENDSYASRLQSFSTFAQQMATIQTYLYKALGMEGIEFDIPSFFGNFGTSGGFDIPSAIKNTLGFTENSILNWSGNSSNTNGGGNSTNANSGYGNYNSGVSGVGGTGGYNHNYTDFGNYVDSMTTSNPFYNPQTQEDIDRYGELLHSGANFSKIKDEEIEARKASGNLKPYDQLSYSEKVEFMNSVESRLNNLYMSQTGSNYKYRNDTYVPSSLQISGGLYAYAKGTMSAEGGLSMVGEQGRELRVLNKGDGILTNKITENLVKLGQNTPNILKNMLIGSNFSQTPNITIGDIHLTGVQDECGLAKKIKERLPNALMQEMYKKA